MDLPISSASFIDILRFCESVGGYAKYGSFEKLAKVANRANEEFYTSGKLPTTKKKLCGCIFFEGRRRHFVWLDEKEHDRYLAALIEKLRGLLGS